MDCIEQVEFLKESRLRLFVYPYFLWNRVRMPLIWLSTDRDSHQQSERQDNYYEVGYHF